MGAQKINKANFKNNIANVIISAYFVLVIIGQFFEGEKLMPIMSALGFCALVWQIPYIVKSHQYLLAVFFLFALYSVFCVFIFQNRVSLTSLRLFVHFVFLILLIRYDIKPSLIRLLVVSYCMSICVLVLVFAVNPNAIFAEASKNFVGWIGLAMGILYYTLLYKRGDMIEIYTACMVLFLAFVCVGRSTIISAILLFLIVFLTSYKRFSLVTKFFAISFIVAGLLFLFSSYFELIELVFSQFDKKGLESQDRMTVLKGYFDKIDISTFLFGVTPNQYPFTILNSNLHNSFLLAHSLFGVFALFFLGYILYAFFRKGFYNLFLKTMLLILLLRSVTDTLLFVAFFDFIVFYILYLLTDIYPTSQLNKRPSKSLAI